MRADTVSPSPTFVTLTGVDAATPQTRLIDLSARFPKVEWGILLGRAETPRYPSIDLINKWADRREQHGLRMALHLCGGFARRWIENDAEIVALARRFDRIQVNVVASRIDLPMLVDGIRFVRHTNIITQHNAANEVLTASVMDCPNHSILFDTSGGRGVAPSAWPISFPGKACGYAGGLGPDTVAEQLALISQVAAAGYWIDMEGQIRTNDLFDLDRCERVLEIVQAHAP